MGDSLQTLLEELERFGEQNDKLNKDRPKRMYNISRETGKFLSVLVRASKASRILEIGTSNGYSTLWLADATRHFGGHVTTLEMSEYKVGLARANFARTDLPAVITQIRTEAGIYLESAGEMTFDFIFLDCDRMQYVNWWPYLDCMLAPGGLLVVDHAVSHADQLEDFVDLVSADGRYISSLVPVGYGTFLAVKSGI